MRATLPFNGLNDAFDLQPKTLDILHILHILHFTLLSGPSPQMSLYFQAFRDSKFRNGCLVV